MSKYGNSYSGNDFLEWWKTHYGTDYDGTSNISKTENMTEEDFAIGQTLLSNYQKAQKIESDFQESSNKLLENYTAAKDTFDKNKRQSQQNASITLDKLKKYLPTQIKAQGLGGLGVSESSTLQAHNNYSRDMGAIESEHTQKMSDLERAYGESLGNLESEKNNLLYYADKDENGKLLVDGVLNKYAEMLADDQDINFDTAMSLILQALHTDEASMNAIVEGFRGKVSDEQLNALFEQGKVTAAGNLSKEHGTNYTTALEAIRGATYTTAEEMNAFVEQYRGKVSDEQLNALFREGTNVAQANKATHDEQLRQEQAVRDETDRQNAYIVAQATVEELIADGDYTGAKNYLDSNKAILGNTYDAYIATINSKVAAQEKADAEAKQAETDKRILEGNEYVQANGSEYKIKSQLGENANEIKKNRDFTEQLNKAGFTNPYDSRIPNGTTFEIKCSDNGENTFDYKDFGLADVTDWRSWIPGYNIYNWASEIFNWNTRCVTYYNGEWYLSEKQHTGKQGAGKSSGSGGGKSSGNILSSKLTDKEMVSKN